MHMRTKTLWWAGMLVAALGGAGCGGGEDRATVEDAARRSQSLSGSDNLGFDGKIVQPDCDAMSSWFECRDISTAPALVRQGFEYVHHTSSTLGPDGTVKFPDGTPYARSSNACSSCHFTGGHVPFGLPFYQVPGKYAAMPYFRAFNYRRDARDSVLDCFKNCMGNTQVPPKDGAVMNAIMAYIEWVSAGVTEPGMRGAGWDGLPGHSWPYFTGDWMNMTANTTRGRTLYENQCHGCHGRDGAGQGEYRAGEPRPRYPALWGPRSYTKGAAMYSVPQLAFMVRQHMPFGNGGSLTEQQALDVAGYINSQPRAAAHSVLMYCANDPQTGLPNSLYKPAHWDVGCVHPEEPSTQTQRLLGPWKPIEDWRKAKLASSTAR
jgi:thiosulfate dehydrogenase